MKRRLLGTMAAIIVLTCYGLAQSTSNRELFPIKVQGRWGYIDRTGNTAIVPQFDYACEFSNGLAAVQVDHKWGFIDGNGKLIGPPQFQSNFTFSGGLSVSRSENNLEGYVNHRDIIVIEPKFDQATAFNEGLAAVRTSSKWGYINKQGQFVIPQEFDSARPFSEGVAFVSKGSTAGYIDHSGKFIFELRDAAGHEFHEGLAAVEVPQILPNGELSITVGFINKDGDVAIPPKYEPQHLTDIAYRYSEGIAIVIVAGKYAYIDRKGRYLNKEFYHSAEPFSEGLAAVKIGESYGYINTNGDLMIPPKYDMALSFRGSLAEVGVGTKCGYINKRGQYVWKPTQ